MGVTKSGVTKSGVTKIGVTKIGATGMGATKIGAIIMSDTNDSYLLNVHPIGFSTIKARL